MIQHQTISMITENRPGTLARIAGVLAARGFNIEGLTLAHIQDPTRSRITVVVNGPEKLRPQIIKKLENIISVEEAHDYSDAAVVRLEAGLIKVRTELVKVPALLKEASVFNARVVDSTHAVLTFQLTGEPAELDAFVKAIQQFGDIEVARSGVILMPKEMEEKKKGGK